MHTTCASWLPQDKGQGTREKGKPPAVRNSEQGTGNRKGRDRMLSEREKMLAGELYDPLDPELVAGACAGPRPVPGAQCDPRERSRIERRRHPRRLFRRGRRRGLDPAAVLLRLRYEHPSRASGCSSISTASSSTSVPVRHRRLHALRPAVQIYTAMHPLDAKPGAAQNLASRSHRRRCLGRRRGGDLPGVTIGSGSVIGAGSVVTRDIPGGVFAAGNPCRIIRPL